MLHIILAYTESRGILLAAVLLLLFVALLLLLFAKILRYEVAFRHTEEDTSCQEK